MMTNIFFIALSSHSSSPEPKEGFNQKVYAILRIIIMIIIITYIMVVVSICLFNKECSFHFVRIIFRTEHRFTVSSPKTTRHELV